MLVTPFDEHERMDEASLRCLVDYEINAGVHGLGISFPGEIDKLTESERTRLYLLSEIAGQKWGQVDARKKVTTQPTEQVQ